MALRAFPRGTCIQPKARNAESYALARQGAVLFQTRRPLCPLFRDSCTVFPLADLTFLNST